MDNSPCSVHNELMKATNELTTSVKVISVNIRWIKMLGGAMFTLSVALAGICLVALFNAGQLYKQVEMNTEGLKRLEKYHAPQVYSEEEDRVLLPEV